MTSTDIRDYCTQPVGKSKNAYATRWKKWVYKKKKKIENIRQKLEEKPSIEEKYEDRFLEYGSNQELLALVTFLTYLGLRDEYVLDEEAGHFTERFTEARKGFYALGYDFIEGTDCEEYFYPAIVASPDFYDKHNGLYVEIKCPYRAEPPDSVSDKRYKKDAWQVKSTMQVLGAKEGYLVYWTQYGMNIFKLHRQDKPYEIVIPQSGITFKDNTVFMINDVINFMFNVCIRNDEEEDKDRIKTQADLSNCMYFLNEHLPGWVNHGIYKQEFVESVTGVTGQDGHMIEDSTPSFEDTKMDTYANVARDD